MFLRNIVTHGYNTSLWEGFCGMSPPPAPPVTCNNATLVPNTAGNGKQLEYYYGGTATDCCIKCEAYTAAHPTTPCLIWSFGPEGSGQMCWLHADASTYQRAGTISGIFNKSTAHLATAISTANSSNFPLLCGANQSNVTILLPPYISQYQTGPGYSLFNNTPMVSLNLTVEETPVANGQDSKNPFDGWINAVADCLNNSVPTDNCSDSFRTALISGAHTIYFPGQYGGFASHYYLYGNFDIPSSVARIVGHSTSIMGNATFVVQDGDSNTTPLIFEGLASYYGASFHIAHACSRSVVEITVDGIPIAPAFDHGYRLGSQGSGVGDVFLNDVVGINTWKAATGWILVKGQRAWARQLDTESKLLDVNVQGAVLWSLGWKTEGGESGLMNISNSPGVEFIGCFNYMNGGFKTAPAITIVDSAVSMQWGGYPFDTGSHPFTRIINETRNGETRVLLNTSRDAGIYVFQAKPPAERMPLFVSLPNASYLTDLVKHGLREDPANIHRLHSAIRTSYGYQRALAWPATADPRLTSVARLKLKQVPTKAQGHRSRAAGDVLTFYVSTIGNDTWDGSAAVHTANTTQGPFATLFRAQQAARTALHGGHLPQIYLRNGTYYLNQTLTFTKDDSGHEGAPVVWCRDPSMPPDPAGLSDVIISGGQPLDTPWDYKVNNLTRFGTWISKSNDFSRFDTIYHGEYRGSKARTPPNPDPTEPFGYHAFGDAWNWTESLPDGYAWFGFSFNKSASNGPNMDIVKYSYDSDQLHVTTMHDGTASRHHNVGYDVDGSVSLTNAMRLPLDLSGGLAGPSGARFVVHGINSGRGFAPSGAFSRRFDRGAYVTTFTGFRNTNMSHASPANASGSNVIHPVIVGPGLDTVLAFDQASHLKIHGISIRHARASCPTYMICDGQGNPWLRTGAVHVSNASTDIDFDAVEVALVAGYGMVVDQGANNINIINSQIRDVGGGGVRLGVASTQAPPLSNEVPLSPVAQAFGINIFNTTISTVGTEYPAATGIHVAGGVANVTIQQSTVSNTTSSGILIGIRDVDTLYQPVGPAQITVRNVLVQHAGLYVTSSLAGVNVVGGSDILLDNNIVAHVYSYDHFGHGIALSNCTIKMTNNLIHDTKSASIRLASSAAGLVSNNIFMSGATSPLNLRLQLDGCLFHDSNLLDMNGSVGALQLKTNIFYPSQGNLFAGDWPLLNMSFAFDSNLYDGTSAKVKLIFPNNASIAAWQALGQDQGSLFGEDPKIDSHFVVSTDSPAVVKLGFKPIDYSKVGTSSGP
jgi:hypothetical protein